MSDSLSLRPAKLRDGRPYEGEQRYAGTGQTRSCNKCGTFKPMGQFRQMRPWGLCCAGCRGID